MIKIESSPPFLRPPRPRSYVSDWYQYATIVKWKCFYSFLLFGAHKKKLFQNKIILLCLLLKDSAAKELTAFE